MNDTNVSFFLASRTVLAKHSSETVLSMSARTMDLHPFTSHALLPRTESFSSARSSSQDPAFSSSPLVMEREALRLKVDWVYIITIVNILSCKILKKA
jgi:hypothetical protein